MQVDSLTYERLPWPSQMLIGAIGLAVVTMACWLVLPTMFSSDATTMMRAAQPAVPTAAVPPAAPDPASPISPSAPEKDGAAAASAPPATEKVGAISDIPLELIPLPKPRRVAAVPVPRARPRIEQDEPPAPASAPPAVPERSFFNFFLNR